MLLSSSFHLPGAAVCTAAHKVQRPSMERGDKRCRYKYVLPSFVLPHSSKCLPGQRFPWRLHSDSLFFTSNVPIYGLQMLAGMWGEDFFSFAPRRPIAITSFWISRACSWRYTHPPWADTRFIFCMTCEARKIQLNSRDVGRSYRRKTQNQDQTFSWDGERQASKWYVGWGTWPFPSSIRAEGFIFFENIYFSLWGKALVEFITPLVSWLTLTLGPFKAPTLVHLLPSSLLFSVPTHPPLPWTVILMPVTWVHHICVKVLNLHKQ